MDALSRWDVRLGRKELRGRTFLLGNKRALSLSLPAAAGRSDLLLHRHKWYGVYLYGRKFLEAQLVRLPECGDRILCQADQTGFTLGLTSARREYEVSGKGYTEEYFVPDGVQGFACTLDGPDLISVEPEFDMRFYYVLNQSGNGYECDIADNCLVVSALLPTGRYDDASESFVAGDTEGEQIRLWAAARVIGDGAWLDLLPAGRHVRRKVFPRDDRRRRSLVRTAAEAADHAPLWNYSSSRVFAPARLHIDQHGSVVYGFGASREEALQQVAALEYSLLGFRAQKSDTTRTILEQTSLETGSERVDTAYTQVLVRLMDALVARHATAEDTALDRPATMILAGNQYFHDSWKRDENIALGFLLSLGFYDLARDIIRDTWQLQDDATGRLPQRIRAGEEPPYHSSDGTLWALLRLYQYWRCTGDDSLLRDKLPMVELFFQRSLDRAVEGLLPSGRTTDPDYLWETWMDTPHTPRDGFPVEIQMLWISALRQYGGLFQSTNPELQARMEHAESAAWLALKRFNVRGMPADSLDGDGIVRDLITPNAYFCFGLGLDLGAEVEQAMRFVGRRQLAGSQGIRTLAPEDWGRVFSPEFLSDRRNVRGRSMRSVGKFNYHRGVEWNWLSRFFVEAELKYGEPDIAYRTYLRSQVASVLHRGGIGGISELYDLSGVRGPEFQAWSMSGFLEAIHAFAGVSVDVPGRRIALDPQLPADWPYLKVRKWYGNIPFDIHAEGRSGARQITIAFPWGEVPDAEIDVAFTLPGQAATDGVEVLLDGIPEAVPWHIDKVPGTGRERVRVSLPARASIMVRLAARPRPARLRRSA